MSDDLNDVKEEVAVETTETPSVEENPTEEVTTEEVEPAGEVEPVETETGESTNKGANQRIRELNAEKNALKEKAQSLAQRLEELTGSNEPVGQPYQSSVEPGTEISPEQYRQDVARQADAIVTLRLKQQEAEHRIISEAKDAVGKYPELNPNDLDHFNKELSEAINEAVEAKVRLNPYTVSVGKFVDQLMKPYHKAVDNEVGKVSENLARQVSQTALKPTQVRTIEKSDNDMTVAELEAKYGVVQT